MADRLDLNELDEYCIRHVVRKMTEKSGPRIYRSCKSIKEVIDRVRPRWGTRRIRILYSPRQRSYMKSAVDERGAYQVNGTLKPDHSVEFQRISSVNIGNCEQDFFETVVIPDLKSMNGVESLELDRMPEENLARLVNIGRPSTVHISDYYYKGDEPSFQNIPSLCIRVHMNVASSYWETPKIFELGRQRKSISLSCNHLYENLIIRFFQRWLEGNDTGSLEELSIFSHDSFNRGSFDFESIMSRVELQNLMSSYEKTQESEFVVEREDHKRIVIQTGQDSLEFHLQ